MTDIDDKAPDSAPLTTGQTTTGGSGVSVSYTHLTLPTKRIV